ncbi:MAG: glyoxylate/hydroxypyruvate reductase A [Alphaproteobacteria bacterium]|jgi:glyoxylate/hydroxypyruvate reductase|nr:glyoxylate/hydroxypyruvate reductase A [Rhodospirillaceae bacterium]MBT6511504.1 glyoxylate/hydroxypyruvate reductase A [Rhodospirillaceae bacterium]MBT7611606.1 glyoxylate/hydroxypyruvate reductase A [Rhodospirillaceae bacterium]MBT7648226.1 glyoxylate/hydroxypyruvate reductase A [Rhodospirillaceae bacterium]MDG2481765.1 glyoxylate/hydroxypyruvate reductase A [Alphaproteobacteria bacterium]
MALLYMSRQTNGDDWRDLLTAELPDLEFRTHPETGDPAGIDAALVWNYPLEELKDYPNLKLVASLGAGVDHVMSVRHLVPEGVTLTRLIDPAMTAQMTEWCLMAMLNHLRNWEGYRALRNERRYVELDVPIPWDVTVGILGLGEMGGDSARVMAAMGYQVRGWSRSAKQLDGVTCFHGHDQLETFLAPCDVVICLLPLTPDTHDVLNARSFGWMKRGAFVINAGRGHHIVEEDLIAAIDSGHLAGATLDVQRMEPMGDDHPFWYHPKIMTFPHAAAFTIPRTCAPQIAENYRRMRTGEPLLNVVDLDRGY